MMCHWLLSFFCCTLVTHWAIFCTFFVSCRCKCLRKRMIWIPETIHECAKNKTKWSKKKPNICRIWGRKLNKRQLVFFCSVYHEQAKRCEMHFKVQCAWALEMLEKFSTNDVPSEHKNSPQLNFIHIFFCSPLWRGWAKEILLFSMHIKFIPSHTHTHLQM